MASQARSLLKRLVAVILSLMILAGFGFMVLVSLVRLAPKHAWAKRASDAILTEIRHAANYPGVLRSRDSHCAALKVWGDMVEMHSTAAWREMTGSLRVLQTDGNMKLWSTLDGSFWLPPAEELALAEELIEQREGEYGDRVSGVHPGDIVLDCGADVGTFTLKALRAGAARVIAIEPAPWALECLRRNVATEVAQGRVVVYPKGVWDREDKLELSVGEGRAVSSSTLVLGRGGRFTAVVPLTTIDHLVEELQLPRVDFVKMDIEGAEPNALQGALHTVERFHPRLAISLEHHVTDPDTIPALTRRLWPDYREQCGPCSNTGTRVQPTMMFAHSIHAAAR